MIITAVALKISVCFSARLLLKTKIEKSPKISLFKEISIERGPFKCDNGSFSIRDICGLG